MANSFPYIILFQFHCARFASSCSHLFPYNNNGANVVLMVSLCIDDGIHMWGARDLRRKIIATTSPGMKSEISRTINRDGWGKVVFNKIIRFDYDAHWLKTVHMRMKTKLAVLLLPFRWLSPLYITLIIAQIFHEFPTFWSELKVVKEGEVSRRGKLFSIRISGDQR